jgi:hypothetical protein
MKFKKKTINTFFADLEKFTAHVAIKESCGHKTYTSYDVTRDLERLGVEISDLPKRRYWCCRKCALRYLTTGSIALGTEPGLALANAKGTLKKVADHRQFMLCNHVVNGAAVDVAQNPTDDEPGCVICKDCNDWLAANNESNIAKVPGATFSMFHVTGLLVPESAEPTKPASAS